MIYVPLFRASYLVAVLAVLGGLGLSAAGCGLDPSARRPNDFYHGCCEHDNGIIQHDYFCRFRQHRNSSAIVVMDARIGRLRC